MRVVVPCVLPVLAHSLTYLRACLVVRAVVGVEQRALLGLVRIGSDGYNSVARGCEIGRLRGLSGASVRG